MSTAGKYFVIWMGVLGFFLVKKKNSLYYARNAVETNAQ
jgi:hypothetical protein